MPTAEGYRWADEVHPLTVGRDKYGCNREPSWPETTLMQNGWTDDGRRKMIPIATRPTDPTCHYANKKDDKRCEGCPRL